MVYKRNIVNCLIPVSQVPQAELETWLVQREPDPPAVVERDRTAPPAETRVGLGMLEDEEDDDDKEVQLFYLEFVF